MRDSNSELRGINDYEINFDLVDYDTDDTDALVREIMMIIESGGSLLGMMKIWWQFKGF